MKTKLLAMVLMAGGTMFAGVRFGVGVGFGGPVVVAQPPCPGPGYVWTNGVWVAPVYGGAYFGRPGYFRGGYYGHPVARGYARGFRR